MRWSPAPPRRRPVSIPALCVAVGLLLGAGASCMAEPGDSEGGGVAPAAELTGRRWMLRTLGGADVEPGERPPSLELREQDGATLASGSAGCNTFQGSCAVGSGSLEFSPLAVSRMFCPGPAMELESRYLRALGEAKRYEVQGTRLVLSGADGELATFDAAEE